MWPGWCAPWQSGCKGRNDSVKIVRSIGTVLKKQLIKSLISPPNGGEALGEKTGSLLHPRVTFLSEGDARSCDPKDG